MKHILPIICLITSIVAIVISLVGLFTVAVAGAIELFGVFAIVTVLIGFTTSVIDCGLSFSLIKSKVCLSAGIISAVAMLISIISLIILI